MQTASSKANFALWLSSSRQEIRRTLSLSVRPAQDALGAAMSSCGSTSSSSRNNNNDADQKGLVYCTSGNCNSTAVFSLEGTVLLAELSKSCKARIIAICLF